MHVYQGHIQATTPNSCSTQLGKIKNLDMQIMSFANNNVFQKCMVTACSSHGTPISLTPTGGD